MTKETILWRGRRNYDKLWMEGNLVVSRSGEASIVEKNVVEYDGHHLRIDSDYPQFFDQETISIFTGYLIGDEKLFNGDFLKYENAEYQVVFDEQARTFRMKSFDILETEEEKTVLSISDSVLQNCSIIGRLSEYLIR